MADPKPRSLPPVLAGFLRNQEYALLLVDTTDGAVLVLKAPDRDIDAIRGPVPILVRWELYRYPTGPIIRLVLVARTNDAGAELVLETFCNPGDPDQLEDLEDALSRPYLRVLCYDQRLRHRLSKRLAQPADAETADIPKLALRMLAETDPAVLDFDAAKAALQAETPLDGPD